MKQKLLSLLLVLCIVSSLGVFAPAAEVRDEICILYTNDVHCGVEENIGYAGLAAYQAEMDAAYGAEDVTLVDAGDAVQGAAIGTLSKGKDIVTIMNKVGYDVITLGNHEFDYGMDQMFALIKLQNAAVVSCNFKSLQTGKTVFEPYKIIDYGDTQIAYVGITTPETFTASNPKYFQDEDGNYRYSFCEDVSGAALYAAVQNAVNQAIAAGADYVVALGHCGVGAAYAPWQSTDIIANTTGIDVFIDGHSHSTIQGETYSNREGAPVILTSTGTKLAAIGKLILTPDGTITTELVTGYTKKDAGVDASIKSIQKENEKLLDTVVAKTDVALVINDPKTGERLIRNHETNLGDLVADAYKTLLGTDIALVNGGGIRADIAAGEITYNDILSVRPFGNAACVVQATGQEILDILEMGAKDTPEEFGGFQQVSGLTYEIHTGIQSSVVLDPKGNFVRVNGPYRVQNVWIGAAPLALEKTYTVAADNYLIKDGGDGFTMLMDNPLIKDEVMLDNQALLTYLVDVLGGVVGDEYKNPNGQNRISVVTPLFLDVAPGAWYSDAVETAVKQGIMNGTSAASFSPDAPLSRAMFVTMLYRMAGAPEGKGNASNVFVDCTDDGWYSAAVAWAVEHKIAKGVTQSTFAPEAALTRQEMVVFLYRYIQSGGGGFQGEWAFRLPYTDVDAIADWAYEAVAYCSRSGLMYGTNANQYAPAATATRAMGAAILTRYAEGLEPSATNAA